MMTQPSSPAAGIYHEARKDWASRADTDDSVALADRCFRGVRLCDLGACFARTVEQDCVEALTRNLISLPGAVIVASELLDGRSASPCDPLTTMTCRTGCFNALLDAELAEDRSQPGMKRLAGTMPGKRASFQQHDLEPGQ